ncbi:MAG: hypothetical protein IKF14_13575 [Atopobiaceae bacterium]|nr:hypothetical protein [Atopobiaceae bacterium]
MSEAQEALADVRGWLCDNLSDGDAGEVCGMLSVVSRHINEIETENIKLQATKSYLLMNSNPTTGELRRVRIEWKKDRDENAKLRELARDLRFCARQSICLKCKHGRICDLRIDERCAELGIEVNE